MWVFKYKLDKHKNLQKCKACLVVCENQQAAGDLLTRATTLASTTFCTLIAIIACFDLETRQLNVVNAFVNCDLDKVVYIRLPLGFKKPEKVLLLKKALYRLRRSPLLWQQKLTNVFTNLGFKPVPQEPYVAISNEAVVFYYVNDIVFAYKKQDKPLVNKAIKGLKKQVKMTDYSKLKWFLRIHMLKDRQRRCL
jgi:hypothetical protein